MIPVLVGPLQNLVRPPQSEVHSQFPKHFRKFSKVKNKLVAHSVSLPLADQVLHRLAFFIREVPCFVENQANLVWHSMSAEYFEDLLRTLEQHKCLPQFAFANFAVIGKLKPFPINFRFRNFNFISIFVYANVGIFITN